MQNYSKIAVLCALAVSLAAPVFGGKVVVFTDEWWTSDTGLGFEGATNFNNFTDNLVSAFGGAGNYLIYSNNSFLTGPGATNFASRLAADGAMVTQSVSASQSLTGFKGVFLAGPITGGAPNATALINYVNAGGNVFLEGGTAAFGDAMSEAAAWAQFLGAFGMSFSNSFDVANDCVNHPVTSANSLFAGVSSLYLCGGQQTFSNVIATTPGANGPLNIASLATTSGGVPEPGTLSMLLIGAALLAVRKIHR